MTGHSAIEVHLFDLGEVLVDVAGFGEPNPLLEKTTAVAEAGMTSFYVRGLAELTHTLRQFGVLPD